MVKSRITNWGNRLERQWDGMKEANGFIIIFLTIIIGRGIQKAFFPDSGLIHLIVTIMIVGIAGFVGNMARKKLYQS